MAEDGIEKKFWYPLWRLVRDPFSPEEALYAVLAAAVMIDQRRRIEEAVELSALSGRSRELSKVNGAKLSKIRAKVDPGLTTEGDRIYKLVDNACASLPSGWRVSAFAHAADLVFADRAVPIAEQRFLISIAEKLKVPPATAEDILTQLRIKNEHLDVQGGAEPSPAPAEPSRYDSIATKAAGLPGSLSKEEALYAILGLAIFADGRERREETEELRALALRTKTLAAVSEKRRSEVHSSIWPQLTKEHRSALFDNACLCLPESLRLSAYGHAADITFADQKVVPDEIKFLQKLAEALQIMPRAAENMTAVLRLKNEH